MITDNGSGGWAFWFPETSELKRCLSVYVSGRNLDKPVDTQTPASSVVLSEATHITIATFVCFFVVVFFGESKR